MEIQTLEQPEVQNQNATEKEQNLEQSHDYIRHIFQMFLTWFAVFATVNYAAIGWLAQAVGENKVGYPFSWIVPIFFIVQNVLAMGGSFLVWIGLKRQAEAIGKIDKLSRNIVPEKLYFGCIILFECALLLTGGAWIAMFFVHPMYLHCPNPG
jgi:hypothetical protein